MDPISLIVTALVAGAAAGAKPTAERAVKDAYEGIKTLIKRKFGSANIDLVEEDPTSQGRQQVLEEDLRKAGAGDDADVLEQAKVLLEALRKMDPQDAAGVGVNLEEIKGASLEIDTVIASRVGVDLRRSTFTGDIKISNVRAGNVDDPNDPL